MKKSALVAALILAIGGTTVAVAQPGGGAPDDPEAIADQTGSLQQGEDGSEAQSEEGVHPDDEGQPENGAQSENGGPAEHTPAAACEGESKEDGGFGECVSREASAFGRCVAEQAQTEQGNPTEACADLKPGNGPPEATAQGQPQGTPQGPPEGVPQGPPEGAPQGPPESVPPGPPESTPSGPPEGTPDGPPAGAGLSS